jgi:hypothetical protein
MRRLRHRGRSSCKKTILQENMAEEKNSPFGPIFRVPSKSGPDSETNSEFLNFEIWTRMTHPIKHEYQEDSEYLNVKIICKDDKFIMVRT